MIAELHDGRKLEFPDGTDPSVVQATVKKVLGVSDEPASFVDKAVGSQQGRLLLGAASPVLSAVQMGANAGTALSGAMGGATTGPMSGPWVNEQLKKLDESKQRGMKALGNEGYDWMGLVGSLMPGAALGTASAKWLPQGAGLMAKSVNSAGQGALGALSTPTTSGGDSESYAKETVAKALLGGALSGAMPGLVKAGGAVAHVLDDAVGPLRQAWRDRAANDFFRKSLTDKGADAASVMVKSAAPVLPGSPLTVADAVAAGNMGKADKTGSLLVAAQDKLATIPEQGISDTAKGIAAKQQQVRRKAIEAFAKTPEELEATKQARDAVSKELYGKAFAVGVPGEAAMQAERASIARSMLASGQAGGRIFQDNPNGPGMEVIGYGSSNPKWYSDLGIPKKRVDEILSKIERGIEEDGVQFKQVRAAINSDHDLNKLVGEMSHGESRLAAPIPEEAIATIKDNPFFKKALPDAVNLAKAEGITPESNQTRFLHLVKLSLDKMLDKTGDSSLSHTEKRAVEGVKQKLLTMMENANDEYRVARESHKAGSKLVNRMEIGQQFQKALANATEQESPTAFLNAEREAARTIKRGTGGTFYDTLDDAVKGGSLKPQDVAAVEKVKQELLRNAERKALGSKVDTGELFTIADKERGNITWPNIMSRPATFTNWMMKTTGRGADERIALAMADLMHTNPAKFAETYLDAMPPRLREVYTDALLNRTGQIGYGAGVAAGRD